MRMYLLSLGRGNILSWKLEWKIFLLREIPWEACVCYSQIIVKLLVKLQMFGKKGELKTRKKNPSNFLLIFIFNLQ